MSLNAKVSGIVDKLFADKLVAGLQLVQQATWITSGSSSFNASTGAVVSQESSQTVNIIMLPDKTTGSRDRLGTTALPVGAEFREFNMASITFVMKPIANKTIPQALRDEIEIYSTRYQIRNVSSSYLGSQEMVWEVTAK